MNTREERKQNPVVRTIFYLLVLGILVYTLFPFYWALRSSLSPKGELFATPVVYPSYLVPEAWRPLYGLNPMAGVVEGFRWALLGTGVAPGKMLVVSVVTVALLVVSGLFYFRRTERGFADVV